MWLCVCEIEWICGVICSIVICILQSFSDGAFLPAILLNLVTCLAPVWGPWRCSSFAGTAAEGPLPTATARLSNIPVCGLWRKTRKTKSPFMWMCELQVETQLEAPNWRFWSCNRAALPWVVLSERWHCGCWCGICKPANNCDLCFFCFAFANSVLFWH